MTLSVPSLSSWNYFNVVSPLGEYGTKSLTLTKAKAKDFRVGGYVDFDGRVWKVTNKVASTDWFKDEYHVRLVGAHYVEGGAFTALLTKVKTAYSPKVAWLEDTFMAGLERSV